ncbi:MAG: DUF47 family protein [Desulfovibrionaceae bacterium]|nr:DUF47 family protein [Desulfovibrionaceae bacterium]
MFAALLPKSAPFFEMLEEQNALLRRMVGLLVQMLEDHGKKDDVHKEIAIIEDDADHLHGRIIRALSQTFITPIDREDILRINQEQEEAMDCVQTLSTRLHIFEFSRTRFPALQLTRTVVSMLDLTKLMLEGLAKREDCHKTRAFRALRAECDMVLAAGLAEVMDAQQEFTPEAFIQIIKWSQIYERMGVMVERIVHVAETIEEAVLKNV